MRVRTDSAQETMAAGRRLGALLKRGDTVCLYGGLGAGKTVFVKGLAQALGIPEREVASASFIIVSEHTSGSMPLYHIDLYRLEGETDLESTGIYEYIGRTDGIAAVEWAERLGTRNAERPGARKAERPGARKAERLGARKAERPGARKAERPGGGGEEDCTVKVTIDIVSNEAREIIIEGVDEEDCNNIED